MKQLSIDSQIISAYCGYRVQAIRILINQYKGSQFRFINENHWEIEDKNKSNLLFNDNRRIHEWEEIFENIKSIFYLSLLISV